MSVHIRSTTNTYILTDIKTNSPIKLVIKGKSVFSIFRVVFLSTTK